MRTSRSQPANTAMQRVILDEAMALLRLQMEKEADYQELEAAFGLLASEAEDATAHEGISAVDTEPISTLVPLPHPKPSTIAREPQKGTSPPPGEATASGGSRARKHRFRKRSEDQEREPPATNRGSHRAVLVPEPDGLGAEDDILESAVGQSLQLSVNAVASTLWRSESVTIVMHAVPTQLEHILAVRDIEHAGMVFSTVKTDSGLISWLSLACGGGIRLTRRDGLFYVHGCLESGGTV